MLFLTFLLQDCDFSIGSLLGEVYFSVSYLLICLIVCSFNCSAMYPFYYYRFSGVSRKGWEQSGHF